MTLCRSRRRQVVEMKCCHLFGWPHNPKVGGSNPPPATNLILLNHKGQRVWRWPFVLFIPCSSVQNFPKFVCNSAFVCRDCVRVIHRGLRLGMAQPIQPDSHWSAELIEQRGVTVPESMEPAPWNPELFQQRMKLAFPYQIGIPWRAIPGRK